MRRLISWTGLLLTFTLPMLAKDNYPLTIKVLSTKNLENKHGSFSFAKIGGNAAGGWSHGAAEHVMAEGSDGNTYELMPDNPKDTLLPGTFQAKIEKRDVKVCEPKDNGKCRDVKFKVVAAEPTAAATAEPAAEPTK